MGRGSIPRTPLAVCARCFRVSVRTAVFPHGGVFARCLRMVFPYVRRWFRLLRRAVFPHGVSERCFRRRRCGTGSRPSACARPFPRPGWSFASPRAAIGRPAAYRNPIENPSSTHREHIENPSRTHREPSRAIESLLRAYPGHIESLSRACREPIERPDSLSESVSEGRNRQAQSRPRPVAFEPGKSFLSGTNRAAQSEVRLVAARAGRNAWPQLWPQ